MAFIPLIPGIHPAQHFLVEIPFESPVVATAGESVQNLVPWFLGQRHGVFPVRRVFVIEEGVGLSVVVHGKAQNRALTVRRDPT